MGAGAEHVEHVEPDGAVIEVVTRAEMRSRALRHRATYVYLLDGQGDLVVHRRADWKDVNPSYWDVAFGGVCDVGEEWATAAARELAEEAGLTAEDLAGPMVDLGPFNYEAEDGSVVGWCFAAHSPKPVTPADGEVVAIDAVPLRDVGAWAEDRSVCPDSMAALVLFGGAISRAFN